MKNVLLPAILGAFATLVLLASIDRSVQIVGAIAVVIVSALACLSTRTLRTRAASETAR